MANYVDAAEVAQMRARFRKAQAMATTLTDEGVAAELADRMQDNSWEIVEQMSRVRATSSATRALCVALMQDRQEQKALLMSNGHRVNGENR